MFFDYFHNVPLPTQSLARLCHPRDGIAVGMLDAWRARGSEPLVIEGGRHETAGLYGELRELGLGSTLAHGIPFQQSSLGAHGFFAFVSLRDVPGERETTLAGMAIPFLFSTYCRALSRDRAPIAVAPAATESALSEREIEILHWVREGKSNHEIGMLLSISPLTVKNHIQRILKKLQASNRTQAVSKAMSLRLLGSILPGAPEAGRRAHPAILETGAFDE
jgi:transcriptional regulator EpsA